MTATSAQLARWTVYQHLTWFLVPIATQCYQPTMPLLITVGLGLPMWQLGMIYFVKMACSTAGYVTMTALLARTSPRTVSLLMVSLRCCSGLLHGLACWEYTPATLPLLYLRSALHGFSIGQLALGPTWIGVRLAKEERSTAMGVLMGVHTVGLVSGPLIGSLMARLLPADQQGYGAGGWWTAASSAVHLLATVCLYDEHELLPRAPKEEVPTVDPLYRRISGLACWVQFFTFMTLLGAESIVAVLMYDMYGWKAGDTLWIFVVQALTMPLAMVFYLKVQATLNYAQMALLWNAGAFVGMATLVHWTNLTEYVTIAQMFVGYSLWLSLSGLGFAGHNAVVAVRLPSDLQASIVPVVQTFGQLGRAFGPLLFTTWYDYANRTISSGAAPNMTILMQCVLFIIGYGVPCFWFTDMYGKFTDGPITAPKGAGEKELI